MPRAKQKEVVEEQNPFEEQKTLTGPELSQAVTQIMDGTAESAGTVIQESETPAESETTEHGDESPQPKQPGRILARIITLEEQLNQALARITQLEQRPPSVNRYQRSAVVDGIWARVKALPGFEHCSCGEKLGPGQKCNAHAKGGNADGLCPEAFRVGKMFQSGLSDEKVREILAAEAARRK